MNMKRILILSSILVVLTAATASAGGSSESEALTTVTDLQTYLAEEGTSGRALSEEELAALAEILGLEDFETTTVDYTALSDVVGSGELTGNQLQSIADLLGLVDFAPGGNAFSEGAGDGGSGAAQYQHQVHTSVQTQNMVQGRITTMNSSGYHEGPDPAHEGSRGPAEGTSGAHKR